MGDAGADARRSAPDLCWHMLTDMAPSQTIAASMGIVVPLGPKP